MIAWLPLALLFQPAWADGLWSTVDKARRDAPFNDLSPGERLSAQSLLMDLVAVAPFGEVPADLVSRAALLGLHLRVEEDQVLLWGADDVPYGVFVVRLGPAPALILEAPHAWFDKDTGQLVATIFDSGAARAAFFNQGHRFGGGEGEPLEEVPPDVAHRPASMFQAATLGAARGLANPLVVQIHGFAPRAGQSVVVSAGSALQPSRIEEDLVAALQEVMGDIGPVVDGTALPALAGKKNVQGKGLSSTAPFLHLELSPAARAGLLAEESRRLSFTSALLGAGANP
jgi:hypothetical protein